MGGAEGGLLCLSLKKSVHLYLSSFISFVKKHLFIHSRHFINLKRQQQCSVFIKYEKIVFQVCILDQFPEFMTCGTFKSIPFKKIKKNKNRKKMLGANRSRPKLGGFEWHRKKLS